MNLLCWIFGHDLIVVFSRGGRGDHEFCSRCHWERWLGPPAAHWRPHTLPPPVGTVALIAMHDENGGGAYLQPELYVYQGDGWRDETAGHELRVARFWWLPESELLRGLT